MGEQLQQRQGEWNKHMPGQALRILAAGELKGAVWYSRKNKKPSVLVTSLESVSLLS